jgi:ribosomal protein L2
MSVRKLKPITPGQRFRVVNGFDAITTDKPERSLIAPKNNSGGRNSQGKILLQLNQLNTIQTERHSLHYYFMLMELKRISLLKMVYK